MNSRQDWLRLYRQLDPYQPPRDELYVEPPRSAAREVAKLIGREAAPRQKFLLIGARGGGKSTELQAIQRHLRATTVTLRVDVVAPESISAFDLLYLQGLAITGVLLRLDKARAESVFDGLAKAYAATPAERQAMGKLEDALQGLSAFTDASQAVANAVGLVAGVAPVVSAVAAAAGVGVKLVRTMKNIVSDSAPEGRDLQGAVRVAMDALRAALQGHELVIVVDGLERMNGQAPERLRDIFERTQLLWHADWSAVYAAPPCAITETNSAHAVGYKVVPVYGFAGHVQGLEAVLRQRVQDAGLPDAVVPEQALGQIAVASGGVPRHAIEILKVAAGEVADQGGAILSPHAVEAGKRELAETLSLGLSTLDYAVLERVKKLNQLPKSSETDVRSSALFGDGRILVSPPTDTSPAPRFHVHPLLEPHIRSRE